MNAFSNLLGRFTLYTSIAGPVSLGAIASLLIMDEKTSHFFHHSLLTICIEVLIRTGRPSLLTSIRFSKVYSTLVFMAANALVLHSLREMKLDMFWFIKPFKRSANEEPEEPAIKSTFMDAIKKRPNHVCAHKQSCDEYFISGLISYLKAGLCLEVIQFLFKNFGVLKTSPILFFKLLPKNIKVNSILFLVSHAGLYRVIWAVGKNCNF